ncbi:hypothetical protein [Actinoplanes derwentensis]|uniref:DUF4190 domain-containing protein n=1 Tax=Actinoplanes derwentensis TaxID=113562 RepID=A0A1H2CLH9_9ACTN|nr:hypothetical protein [Actinoplanes derwentensis]GID82765.1 hypothetical protein Ade03nite_16890 [Actinoplanes derwentensis]SDT71343.1 hypothetical protein SAMN04489716_6143 [Actinoplanes derwentensis]
MTQPPGAAYPPPQPGPPYYSPYGQPPPYGAPPPFAPAPPPPPVVAGWQPERVDQVTGTGFGLVHFQVAPITSGPAIGSLVAGIAAILVALAVFCFGLAGAQEGWGGWVAGAFTLLSVLACAGAVTAALIARRQITRSAQPGRVRFTGRGLTIGGMVCGIAGAALSLVGLSLGLVVQLS